MRGHLRRRILADRTVELLSRTVDGGDVRVLSMRLKSDERRAYESNGDVLPRYVVNADVHVHV